MVHFEHKLVKEKSSLRARAVPQKPLTDIGNHQDCGENTVQNFVNNTMKNGGRRSW